MIDITVNGTTGEVNTNCRAESISGCRVCRIVNVCKICIYGEPFSVSYEVDGVRLYGQCECPTGYYKTKENMCESLEEVDVDGLLSEESVNAASIEELVKVA